MKKTIQILLFVTAVFFMSSCSSSKNATDLKATNGNLAGTWTLSNISVDVPAGFKVTNIFDQAPYPDFKGSTWDLKKNGKGSFFLTNGSLIDIYWSINGKGEDAQFQFKKLNGEKPKNVEEGYRLQLQDITSNSFIAKSTVDVGDGKSGYITYTFTK